MPNACGQKVSRFQQNIPGRFSDPGFFAAHDTADSDRALLVGNDAIVRLQQIGFAVEREKFFAVARESDVDVAIQLVGIEGVRRLAELEHHEV